MSAILSALEKRVDRFPKAVACFSGSRDHYQLALALQEVGFLEKLVTDLYWEPRKLARESRITKLFPKLLARHTPGLPQSQVITPPGAMFDSLLMKTMFASRSRQIRLDRMIGLRARRESWKLQTALFSYSYYAAEAFAPGERQSRWRFLFQLHPHPATVRRILGEEMLRSPEFKASLQWEHELGSTQRHFESLCEESRLANGWIVASSYTASTLAENGVPRNQIHVVPYGVNFGTYPCRDCPPPATKPFRVVWVGSMTQRKGLSYFLEAIGSLPQEGLEVLICGRSAVDRRVIENYGIKSVRILQGLATADLAAQLRQSDLFVLPSLAEGFGHVILEAMASGVPVVTTSSTCAPDVFKDGEHGFIVPIRDIGALVRTIKWGSQHRSELYQMGLGAAKQARTFTWQRFRAGVVKAYQEMVEQIAICPGLS
jgi:glycosyltransferase involved in cell wall biosynthesis